MCALRALVAVPALAALVVVAAALGALADRPDPQEARPCGTRGDGNRPQQLPSPAGVRIGPLVIWPSVRTRVEDARNGAWRYYVKAPIVLPARQKVILSIPPEVAYLVGLQSRANGLVSIASVRFEACREGVRAFPGAYDGTVGKYTGFPFGFWLARRSACIPLEVWVDGRATPIRRLVPFGRASC